MSEDYGRLITEEGPVTIRDNATDDSMRYNIRDWHGNCYPVSNHDELRNLRDAIDTVLSVHNER